MTKLSDVLDRDLLAVEVEAGYVKRNRHPSLPLSIYAYTRPCQYEGHWNDITRQCRGLIVDDDENVVARPFTKFFNVGEHESDREYAPPLPVEPFRVYEKVDGSLGILFYFDNYWRCASKGSFISEQARWMTDLIEKRYADLSGLDADLTYCTEIIYPENRIVVNYGDRSDLVLLAAFYPDGSEVGLPAIEPLWHLGSVVTTYGGGDSAAHLARLMALTAGNRQVNNLLADGTNAEGYVIRFASGVRAKAKFAEYVRLHRLLTGVTERDIWRALGFDLLSSLDLSDDAIARGLMCSLDEVRKMKVAPNGAMASIVEGVPDEFDAWVQSVATRLENERKSHDEAARMTFNEVSERYGTADRGTFARGVQAFVSNQHGQSLCFALLDSKPIEPLVWKFLYPAASTPFKEDDDG